MKNVAVMPTRSSIARISGTATLASYVPWDSTPGRSAFEGFVSHTSSASKSNVNAAAARLPSGHIAASSLVTAASVGPPWSAPRLAPTIRPGPKMGSRRARDGCPPAALSEYRPGMAPTETDLRSDRPAALAAIGSTPIVRLTRLAGPDMAEVWVKLEGANPTGSYKDRMALAMIEGAERSGRLRPGQTVVEYT